MIHKFETLNGQLGYFEAGVWYKAPLPFKFPDLTLEQVHGRVARIEHLLRDSLTYHVDIHMKSNSEVIVVGVLNGRDFFKRFSIPPGALPDILKIMEEFNGVAQRGHIDLPYHFPRF